jgi:hypothetical protein
MATFQHAYLQRASPTSPMRGLVGRTRSTSLPPTVTCALSTRCKNSADNTVQTCLCCVPCLSPLVSALAPTICQNYVELQGRVALKIQSQVARAWASNQELYVSQASTTTVDLTGALQQSLPSAADRASVAWRITQLPDQGAVRHAPECNCEW